MDEKILKSKKVAELREVAKAFGVHGSSAMKKEELIASLLSMADEKTSGKAATKKEKNRRNILKSKDIFKAWSIYLFILLLIIIYQN